MSDPSVGDVVIFTEALQLPVEERGAFLDRACADDEALRRHVRDLLESHAKAGEFLDQVSRNGPCAKDPSAVSEVRLGDCIGRYKLVQQLGEGGCGVVFLAEQEEPVRRMVALKIIKPGMDTKSVIARFEAERQALALMEHPNIAKVLDAGTTDAGRPYFVMELVRGIKITDYCDQHSLSNRARLELFIQVCHAVQHAHLKGVIHRDIKPSNILVASTEQGAPVPKVIDFGIAKATSGQLLTDKTLVTAVELLIGTPDYMSPEQAAWTSVDVDTRTDIYSLGVLLYELLTGTTPFDTRELLRSGLDEIRRVILDQEPERPSRRLSTMVAAELTAVSKQRKAEAPKLIRSVRGDLDWIVMMALEKDRARRYSTANELAEDVKRFLANESVSARPPTKLYQLKKLVLRNQLLFGSLGVVAILLATGFVMAVTLLANEFEARREADRARAQAETDKRKAQAEAAKSQQVTFFLQEMLEGAGPTVALGRDTSVLRDIMNRTDARVAKELTNQPAVEADLRFTMGRVYEDLGAYSQAVQMFRRVLELNRRYLPEETAEIAYTLSLLGRVLFRDQKVAEAERQLQASLAIWQKLREEERLQAGVALEALAMVRLKQGNLAEAEAMIRRTRDLRLKHLPEDSTEVQDAVNNLGTVLFAAGRFGEAEDLYRRLLAANRKQYGDDHPSVAFALQNLGTTLAEQSKMAEAKETLGRAVAMRSRLLGEQHPSYTASIGSLGNILQRSGNYAEAEELYRRALAQERQRLGGNHPEVLHTALCLTRTLAGQKKQSEIVSVLKDYLTPEYSRMPESVPMLEMRMEALARMGRWKEAAVDAAYAVKHSPAEHQYYHTLAPLLVASGDLEAYAKLCREIVVRFGDTSSVSVADRMAKDCLFHPASGCDLSRVAALAENAVTKGRDRAALPFFQVCKALAELRQGHFPGAAEWAGKAAESKFPYAAAEAEAVLAMSQHHLGRPEAARVSLAKAAGLIESALPKLTDGDLGSDWRDWIIARMLLAEARALIEAAANSAGTQAGE